MNVLVINAGSSSLKYQFFNMPSEKPLSTGLVEKIGEKSSLIRHKLLNLDEEIIFEQHEPVSDHSEALGKVITLLSNPDSGVIGDVNAIDAIGHRVVHG